MKMDGIVYVVRCATNVSHGLIAVFSNKEKARLFSNTILGSWVCNNLCVCIICA